LVHAERARADLALKRGTLPRVVSIGVNKARKSAVHLASSIDTL